MCSKNPRSPLISFKISAIIQIRYLIKKAKINKIPMESQESKQKK